MALVPKTNTDGIGYIGASSTLDGTVFENGTKYAADTAAAVIKAKAAETLAGAQTYAEDQVKATGFVETDPSTGYSFAVQDAEGRVSEIALDLFGKVPQWVLDRWGERKGWGKPTPETGAPAFQREALVSAFKQRRGGRIGTSGRAVVCLRFDHGWNSFVSTILPLLRARALPATQMVNPATMTDTLNNAVSYADVQSIWLSDGIEVANHAQSHGTATTDEEIYHHIVQALYDIQANLPYSKVEAYIPGGKAGEGVNDFSGSTVEEFYKTTGGKLSMAHHAAVFGYIPGIYRVLPQDMNLGGGHVSGDTWTLTNLKNALDDTIYEGAATTFMFHPENIGKTGNVSVADFTALLDYIVSQRDAGKIEVLTMTGSLLADPGTANRHNLIYNGSFAEGLLRWNNTTGWTAATGSGVSYATTTTGGLLRQFESGRHLQQIESSNRELHARFRAPAGAVVRVSVVSSANGLTASREVTLPAASTWVTVRQPFSIPIGGSALTFDVGRVSGGAVDVTDIRSHTI